MNQEPLWRETALAHRQRVQLTARIDETNLSIHHPTFTAKGSMRFALIGCNEDSLHIARMIAGSTSNSVVSIHNAIDYHEQLTHLAPAAVWSDHWEALLAGGDVDAERVLAHAGERLAAYKRPKQVFFVDSLPRNVNGKLQRRALG